MLLTAYEELLNFRAGERLNMGATVLMTTQQSTKPRHRIEGNKPIFHRLVIGCLERNQIPLDSPSGFLLPWLLITSSTPPSIF